MIRVLRAGLLTTVQDLGRHAQRHGVSGGGAMDRDAARVANLLVGNPPGDAVLEATVLGPALRFDSERLVAITGGEFDVRIDDTRVDCWRPVRVDAGSTLDVRSARHGCRAYIAVGGGIDVPPVLGARATDLMAGFGGLEGRALVEGDVLPLGDPGPRTRRIRESLGDRIMATWAAARSIRDRMRPRVRFIAGPEWDWFTADAQDTLEREDYRVDARSNRMGFRFDGATLERARSDELISSPVTFGTIQVPADGLPIVLMADRQTTGGYPRIGHVIAADLPIVAQLPPGGAIRFTRVELDDALVALRTIENALSLIVAAISRKS